jgi:hypothetical protein
MEQVITWVVDTIVMPITSLIALMASSGAMLLVFGALWTVFAFALVRDQAGLDATWLRLRHLPLIVQALIWLLFLPVMLGLFIWRRAWPPAARMLVIAGIAGWNLLVFLPQPT